MSIFPRGKSQEKEARKWDKEVKKGKGGWGPFFSLMRWHYLQGQGEKLEDLIKQAPTQELRRALEIFRLYLQGEKDIPLRLIEDLKGKDKREEAWLALLRGLTGDPPYLQRCLQLYPNHPWAKEVKITLGQVLLKKGKGEDALGHLVSLESEKDPQVCLLIGQIYHQMGNDLAARSYLERAMARGQGGIKTRGAEMVVRLARQREEWDKVASALKILLERATAEDKAKIQKELAEVFIKGGKIKEAIKVMEGLPSRECQALWILLATTLEEKKDWHGAVEAWEKVEGLQALLGKGRALLSLGKNKEAIKLLEGSKEWEGLYLLARALWESGDREDTLTTLRSLGEEGCKALPQAALLRAQAALELQEAEEAALWALEAFQGLPQEEKRQAKTLLKKVKAALKETPDAKKWLPVLEEAVKESPLFHRLKEGLFRSRQGMTKKLEEVLGIRGEITREDLERVEEVLISADVGVETTAKLIKALERKMNRGEVKGREGLMTALKEEILLILSGAQGKLEMGPSPWVIMMVGVNGTGKTTTIAKLARRLTQEGKKVILAAGDTFRAAAIEQMEVWAQRVGVPVVKQQPGSHPSGVVYDALQAARARGTDVVIVDTAGRLHTKVNLMEELKKMVKVASKELPGAPQETLLVLDATTGQNALSQARLFSQAVPVTGLVLTKLDGTARGGIIIAVAGELVIPVKLIGVGEGMDDLQDFDAEAFAEALFEAY